MLLDPRHQTVMTFVENSNKLMKLAKKSRRTKYYRRHLLCYSLADCTDPTAETDYKKNRKTHQ